MLRRVPTRRELMDRAEARLRTRGGGEEGALEASRCFLRAMLVGVDENASVPHDLVARVGEFLKIDLVELLDNPALRRQSTRPPTSNPLAAPPGERRRRVLLLGRADAARLAMLDAVGRTMLADDAEVRAAALTPIGYDARALKVLRHSGYATEQLNPRSVSVDDLSWADLVLTVGGEREDWERFLPRSIPHQHEPVEDPIALTRELADEHDELEIYRTVLRAIERIVAQLRPPRSSRLPAAAPLRASWSRFPVTRPESDEPPSRRR